MKYYCPQFRIDHGIIFLHDLSRCLAPFTKRSFTISPGGKHLFGTFNQLIPFLDGSYLELVSFENGMKGLIEKRDQLASLQDKSNLDKFYLETRWCVDGVSDSKYGHIVDLCIAAVDSHTPLETLFSKTMNHCSLLFKTGQRKRAIDDQVIKWNIGVPFAKEDHQFLFENHHTLPFLIEDLTDRNLRVPHSHNQIQHENGIQGILSVHYIVDNLETSTKQLQEFLQAQPVESTSSNQSIFQLYNNATIVLEQFDQTNQSMVTFREAIKGIPSSQKSRFPFSFSFYTKDNQVITILYNDLFI